MYNNAIAACRRRATGSSTSTGWRAPATAAIMRWEHASLECCPPNLVRFLASMPGYIYAQEERGAMYVNLYRLERASFPIEGQDVASRGRERDAVGRTVDDHGVGERGAQAARSSCGFPAGRGTARCRERFYSYLDKTERPTTAFGERPDGHGGRRRVGLRVRSIAYWANGDRDRDRVSRSTCGRSSRTTA